MTDLRTLAAKAKEAESHSRSWFAAMAELDQAASPTAILALYAEIDGLREALEVTRKLVADAAVSGFTEIEPLERLYAHQAELTRAITKEPNRDRE